jgi:predicted 3-demethylubiquinone-9 3-methyltransferase (glyoxalase superfamily)
MAERITPFLMFEGKAEEAMDFYRSLFPDARVERLERFGPEGPGAEGTILHAELVLKDQRLRLFDSPVAHAFGFTPSFSLFVDCESEAEVARLFAALSEGGQVMMELAEYPFARKFAWLADRFGVSWQLSLASAPSAG